MKRTPQQKLFYYYVNNGGFVDLDGDFQTPQYSGHRYNAGVVARNDQELQEIGKVLRELEIQCVSTTYPTGKLVQLISGRESVRLFKRILDEVADAYVFAVPEKFRVADCEAYLDFKTSSSASFHLGEMGDVPANEKRGELTNVFCIFGWLDLHFAAEQHVRFQIRVGLFERAGETVGEDWLRADETKIRQIVQDVFAACAIPADETYIARFCVESYARTLWQNSDRFGCSSVIG